MILIDVSASRRTPDAGAGRKRPRLHDVNRSGFTVHGRPQAHR